MRLRGVGKAIEKHLSRLDIFSVQDLLLHLPARYQNRTQVESIRQTIPGTEAVIEGSIQSVDHPLRGRTKLLCELRDHTGKLYLRFFHAPSFLTRALKPGVRMRCYGTVRQGPKGLEMVHPEFQVILEGQPIPVNDYLTPIYPATEGLTQHRLRKLMSNALTWMENQPSFKELLPAPLLKQFSFPSLMEAITFVHRPPGETNIPALLAKKTLSQRRLVFEELLAHRLSLLTMKQAFKLQSGIALNQSGTLEEAFLQGLSFKLTHAQERTIKDIFMDLSRACPMLRLVQGDVGSGKTVVAAMAMLRAIESGYQAAMMAPTELLAEQHYHVFRRWLEPLGVSVVLLSSSIKGRARTLAVQAIAMGQTQVVLGTHALFQEKITFAKLALVIIDEQHRFGVQQRALFLQKGLQSGDYPHQLMMTATPIPRTLAMSFYADLDCSTIDELPPGRTPIATTIVASSRRDEVIARIREACFSGRQVYWVCPLIDESENLTCQAASNTFAQLKQALSDLTVGLVHGRMNSVDKKTVMQAFQKGEIHVLVATTVIEVGVDVANASVMIIENAERMGLSQLHQLRGRVGRGSIASYCILMYQLPLSPLARERLSVMRETNDGFKIAERDLALRGPGEVLGTRQTGEITFRVADLMRDSDLLPAVHQAADLVMREHSDMINPLIHRWLGDDKDYGKV